DRRPGGKPPGLLRLGPCFVFAVRLPRSAPRRKTARSSREPAMTADRPRLTPLAESLPSTVPFVGPETQERSRGRAFRARLGANENGFGPAPSVREAMATAAGEMWKYCDPDN